VDEYLRLLDTRDDALASAASADASAHAKRAAGSSSTASDAADVPTMTRAQEYQLKKELASTERKLETLGKKTEAIRVGMATVDHSDYVALLDSQQRLRDAEQQLSDLEAEWLRLIELLG
jgi:acetyl-CoA acetyltransferase